MHKPLRILILTLILSAAPAIAAGLPDTRDISYQYLDLVAQDGAASDQFGFDVAVDGDTVLIGAGETTVDGVPNSGAAYVFVRDGDGWVEQARLTDPELGSSRFGRSVALSGDTALIGVSGQGASTVYVFVRTGQAWALQATLSSSETQSGDSYGTPVALDGDTALVGAHTTDVDGFFNQGAAYVFTRDGEIWTEEARLTADEGLPYSLFGEALAIAGDTIVISAPFQDVGSSISQGAGYVFVREEGQWSEQARLSASDGAAIDNLGRAVAASPNRAVLSSPRASAVYVFDRVDGEWSEQARLSTADEDLNLSFGMALALDEDRVLVGAPYANDNQGTAYLYEIESGTWLERGPFTTPHTPGSGRFGNAVGLAGDALVAGEPMATVSDQPEQGRVFIIEPAPAPGLTLDPTQLDFGHVPVGTASAEQLSVLTNITGDFVTELNFTSPGGDFTSSTAICGDGLVPDQFCPVFVTFTPSEPGPVSATIEISSAETEPVVLELVATGVDTAEPVASITPETLEYDIIAGDSASDNLQIGNEGGSDLTWTIDQAPAAGSCASPSDVSWLDAGVLTGTTTPGETASVEIIVDAGNLTPGTYTAQLCVTTNDPKAALINIPVAVTVSQAPVVGMAFTAATLAFDEVETGTVSHSMIATLENFGEIALAGLNFSVPGSGFEIDAGRCGTTLPAGESCPINITFTPTTDGPATATLEAGADADAQATLELSATGLDVAHPAADVHPSTLSATLMAGDSVIQELELGNNGTGTLDWALAETAEALARIESIPAGENVTAMRSAAIDPAGEFAYYTVSNLPGQLVKVDLESFEVVDVLIFSTSESLFNTIVIEPKGEYAFLATGMPPARVVKIDLDTFERVGHINLESGEAGLMSAVIDPAGQFAYFGTNPSPGRIVKVDLHTFERVGSIAGSGGGFLQAAAMDPAGEFAYFGTGTGHVRKIDLGSFEEVNVISLPDGEQSLISAVIDPSGTAAYFGTSLPGRIVRIDLDTFQRTDSLTVPSAYGNQLPSALMDPLGEHAYFGLAGGPGWLVKVALDPFEVVDARQMGSEFSSLGSGVIDQTGDFAWLANGGSTPGYLVHAGLRSDCTLPDWVQLSAIEGSVEGEEAGTVEVTLVAAGLEPGAYQARICLSSNDPSHPLIVVPVSLAVEAPDMPGVLDVEPGMHDFGGVDIGDEILLEIDVANVAAVDADLLILESIEMAGDGTFVQAGGDCTPGMELLPQQNCTLVVAFGPEAEQSYAAVVEVTTEDGQTQTVDLLGVGIEPPDQPDEIFRDRFESDH